MVIKRVTETGEALDLITITQNIQCVLAYGVNNVLAANFNGTFSASTQPDVARNLIIDKVGATAAGGQCDITGLDQFGNPITETVVFAAGAETKVGDKIFMSIDANGIVISALTAGDTISVGLGNKLGLDHEIETNALLHVCKTVVGDYTASATEDDVYYGVTMAANIAANDVYQITTLCYRS